MKQYEKQIDGKSVFKTLKEIVVKKNGMQTFNPSEEMVLADGWVEYVAPAPVEPSEEQLVERARRRLIVRINEHDESQEVNVCYLQWQGQTIPYWADKSERATLVHAIEKFKAAGNETYRLDLREVGVSVDIPCDSLLQMMAELEVYAIRCFNKTTDHLFAAKQLTTVEEMEAYNYRVGYPDIPRFEL